MQPATLNSAKITAALIIMSDSFQSQSVHRDTMILENIRREPFEFPV
jgi:tetraacyldisaccharide-1-P 4'-kinase